jgi:hypothetical protein
LTYLLTYVGLCLGGSLTFGHPPARKVIYAIALIFLFVFVGFRYEVGCDWNGYALIFDYARYSTIEDSLQGREPAFSIINYLLNYYDLDYPYINVISAAIFFLGLCVLARRQPDPLGVLILAFPVLIINLPMSAIRQAMALGVLCVAYNAFVDRKVIRYVVLVMFAASFHYSAIAFFVLAPFIGGQRGFALNIALAGLLTIFGYYFLHGTFEMYSERYLDVESEHYMGEQAQAAGAVFRAGLLALTGAVFIFFLSHRWKASSPRDHLLVWLGAYLMVAVLPLSVFSSVAGDRFGYYLNPIQLIILARVPLLFRSRHSIGLATVPYAASGIVLFTWTYFSQLFQFCYLPYKLWW